MISSGSFNRGSMGRTFWVSPAGSCAGCTKDCWGAAVEGAVASCSGVQGSLKATVTLVSSTGALHCVNKVDT